MRFIPTNRQSEAIQYPSNPLLIIAGAGTGKTSTLIYRIQNKIENGKWNPKHIVVLTFTDRAVQELSQKISFLLGNCADEITIATFHSFCNRLVREYSEFPDTDKLLLKEDDITFLLLSRFDKLTFLSSQVFKTDPVRAVTKSFIPFFNRIRDELLSPEELENKFNTTFLTEDSFQAQFPGLSDKIDIKDYINQFTDLLKVYITYQIWKKELNVVDYSDMIFDCWEMLRSDTDILTQVRQQFRHIIIDEYQDNNYALNRIISQISGDSPCITVVGDEDQCIYSFRGANYYNIQDFRQKYEVKKNRGEVTLEENHRSTQEILDLANVSITHDINRTPKTLKSACNRHGSKPIWHVGIRKQIKTFIPHLINTLIKEGNHYGDIAILCRSWNHVKLISKTLQEASIPTDVFLEQFFNVPAIKDVLSWSHLICDDLKTDMALFRILTKYLGRPFAQSFFSKQTKKSLEGKIEHLQKLSSNGNVSKKVREQIFWILEIVKKLRQELFQYRQADEMVWEILKLTDLLHETRNNYRYSHRLTLANIGHLMTLAESFSIREDKKTLDRWLFYMDILSLNSSYPAIQPESHDTSIAVQVMTIHKSKGLEFPIVIIPFLQAVSFPTNRIPSSMIDQLPESWYNWPKQATTTTNEEHLNEERRIFYVAITRTIEQLHLFGPDKAQSVFIKELLDQPVQIMERRDMAQIEPISPEKYHSETKQKLLIELNRELSAHQYKNAHDIIDGLQAVEETGILPVNHPYAPFLSDLVLPVKENSEGKKEIVNLSASSVEEYSRCPFRYRLSKIDKVPERKSKVQMEFGIIIHNILQEYHRSRNQDLEFLLSLLDKFWRKEAFEYLIREEEFKRQGKQILQDYFNFFQINKPDVLATEARFDFQIKKINVQVSGKIDRIDRDGEKLTVIDYKTSKNKEKAKSSLQLALYTEALQRNAIAGIKGDVSSAHLHFLRHPEDPIESHSFSKEDLVKQITKVEKAAKGIRRKEFDPKTGWHCDNCDYQEFLCPAWEDK